MLGFYSSARVDGAPPFVGGEGTVRRATSESIRGRAGIAVFVLLLFLG